MDRQTVGSQKASDINNGNEKYLPNLSSLCIQKGFMCMPACVCVCAYVYAPLSLGKKISEYQEMYYRVFVCNISPFLGSDPNLLW